MTQINNEDLYYVLMRNEKFKRIATLEFLFKPKENMDKVIELAKTKFQPTYDEAIAIVTNPDREVVSMYKDEMEWFANKYEGLEFDYNSLIDLVNDYLEAKELQEDFSDHIKNLKKQADETHESPYGDIDEHLSNFMF